VTNTESCAVALFWSVQSVI